MNAIPVSLTVLGCGNATGVPTVGCTCAVCRSPSVRNQRLRCSALLRIGGQQWLIDSGPDLRRQALAAGIDQVDGVLYTHPHSDHINGIDDLRAYCERLKTPIPVYGNPATLAALHHSYSYAFLPPGEFWHRPVLLPNLLPDGGFAANGVPIQGYDCPHGRMQSTVYRIGNIAWATDISPRSRSRAGRRRIPVPRCFARSPIVQPSEHGTGMGTVATTRRAPNLFDTHGSYRRLRYLEQTLPRRHCTGLRRLNGAHRISPFGIEF